MPILCQGKNIFGIIKIRVISHKNCYHHSFTKVYYHHSNENYFELSGLYYKSFTIVIYDCKDMVSIIKLNYDHKALACVVNYDRKHDATIWSVNLTVSFTIVICL